MLLLAVWLHWAGICSPSWQQDLQQHAQYCSAYHEQPPQNAPSGWATETRSPCPMGQIGSADPVLSKEPGKAETGLWLTRTPAINIRAQDEQI